MIRCRGVLAPLLRPNAAVAARRALSLVLPEISEASSTQRGRTLENTPSAGGARQIRRSSSSSSSSPSPSPNDDSNSSSPPEIVYDRHYINGEWVTSLPSTASAFDSDSSSSSLYVYDSNTGLPFASVPSGSSLDADRAAEAASSAFERGCEPGGWSVPSSLPERREAVRIVAEAYEARRDDVAALLTRELGAPVPFARNVQAAMFKYQADRFLEVVDEYPWEVDLGKSLVTKEAAGVVAAIAPWNWPVHQIAAKVAPALLAGCSVVLKPSEVAPLNAFVLAEVIEETGVLPPGAFNLVSGTGPVVGEALASHPLVDVVSFTGSTRAGRRVHELGSRTIKRVRTELGGKSACVVLDDADPSAVRRFALNVLENAGQTCSAHVRMLVPRDRADEVVAMVGEAYGSVRVVRADDPAGRRADVGPLASKEQLERVRGYIRSGMEEGARLVTGGPESPEGVPAGGYFVRPTVFDRVEPHMKIAREEIFGPVLCIMPYNDIDDAVAIANGTEYGLSGAVLGRDEKRARGVAGRLRTGEVFVNTLAQSPVAPFGGYGQSGDGRELGMWGLEEYLQVKAIHRRPQKK